MQISQKNPGTREKSPKGMKTCFAQRKGRKHEPHEIMLPFSLNSFNITMGFWYLFSFLLSPAWLFHFPAKGFDFIFNLPNTSCCQSLPIKGLSSKSLIIKANTEHMEATQCFGKSTVRMPKSESSPARSSLESLEPTAESHSSHP